MARRKLHVLDYPVELAARRHALGQLDEAAKAATRIEAGDDPEALHDLRVAIRRLRTTLQSYAPWLGAQASKARQRLGKIIKQTNHGRDREVHLAWLQGQLAGRVSSRVRTGIRIMLDEIESGETADKPVDAAAVVKPFKKIQRKLRSSLVDTGSAQIAVQKPTTYAVATASLVEQRKAALRDDLREVHSIDDVDADHTARLSVKKLRYVIEPIASQVAGGKAIVNNLKKAQDVFGDLHDLQVLEQHVVAACHHAAGDWSQSLVRAARGRGPASGDAAQLNACRALAALIKRIRAEQTRLFRRIERQWLGEKGETFFGKIDDLIYKLDPSRKPAPDEPQSVDATEPPPANGA